MQFIVFVDNFYDSKENKVKFSIQEQTIQAMRFCIIQTIWDVVI